MWCILEILGSYCVYFVSHNFLVTNSSLKGNFPSDVSSKSTSNPARSLSLVNALSACCLSTWLPPSHRQWSAVELVKTLASKTKSKERDQALDTCISADLQGTTLLTGLWHAPLICLFRFCHFHINDYQTAGLIKMNALLLSSPHDWLFWHCGTDNLKHTTLHKVYSSCCVCILHQLAVLRVVWWKKLGRHSFLWQVVNFDFGLHCTTCKLFNKAFHCVLYT